MYCRNRPNVISNDLKCAGGWGSAPAPAGGAYDAPPDPLIVSGFAPKALAPRPLRRLKADPPSFFGTNLTLPITRCTDFNLCSHFISCDGRTAVKQRLWNNFFVRLMYFGEIRELRKGRRPADTDCTSRMHG